MNTKKICGARNRNGGICQNSPMLNGRCHIHGGSTPHGPANPNFKHGRYAAVFRNKLSEKYLEMSADKDQLNLLPELAVERTLLADLLEKLSRKKVIKTPDIQAVTMLTKDVLRTVRTIAKIRDDMALTLAEIKFIQTGMINLMTRYVPDLEQRQAFITELRGLIPGTTDTPGD